MGSGRVLITGDWAEGNGPDGVTVNGTEWVSKNGRYVTATGRAISKGKQTRVSRSVKRTFRKGQRPLPLDLQCHPPALRHTPVHPGCSKSLDVTVNQSIQMVETRLTLRQHMRGVGLKREGPYALVHYSTKRVCGYALDLVSGMAWLNAAFINHRELFQLVQET